VQRAYESWGPAPVFRVQKVRPCPFSACPVRPQNANCIPNACVAKKDMGKGMGAKDKADRRGPEETKEGL